MSTFEIKDYFKIFGEVEITWINDSACRIKFSTDDIAKKAYKASSLSSSSND